MNKTWKDQCSVGEQAKGSLDVDSIYFVLENKT